MPDKFINCRDWRSFLHTAERAGHTAERSGPYPSVAAALKAGRAWLSGGAATSYGWLRVNGNLVAGARKTLGI